MMGVTYFINDENSPLVRAQVSRIENQNVVGGKKHIERWVRLPFRSSLCTMGNVHLHRSDDLPCFMRAAVLYNVERWAPFGKLAEPAPKHNSAQLVSQAV